MRLRIIALGILLFLSCFIVEAMDAEFPLVQSITYFPFEHYPTLEKNQFRLSLNMYYSSVYMFDADKITINDMETWSNTLSLGYGLTPKITLELYARTVVAYRGVLDQFIIDFHNFFGLPQGGREDFPLDVMNYRYKDYFAYTTGKVYESPVMVGVLAELYNRGNFRVNGRISVGLPLTPKAGFSTDKPSLTGGITFLYKSGPWTIAFANHLALYKNPGWMKSEDLKNQMFHSELRVDFHRIFGGFFFRSSPFRADDLQHNARQMFFGFRFLKRFEFSMIEEFPPLDTSPDVSFNLRIKIL